MPPSTLQITYPSWVEGAVDWARPYDTDEAKMGVAVEMSRQNVLRQTGGPFGAAVFEEESGRLVAVGMNLVVAHHNCLLHAEVVAFMMAQACVGAYTLHREGGPRHVLATSCEPCAMCLGATLWSGVGRVLIGATREDVLAIGFEEGPVFPESYAYLERCGLTFTRGVLRPEAAAVLALYQAQQGTIYNR
jgi:tRNA(Arg) A34 adenosine deaminase TadA